MVKSMPSVAMALCFTVIASVLEHTVSPPPSSPLTTPQSTDFKCPRSFVCIPSSFYAISNSLFIAAVTVIEAWGKIRRYQIWDLGSEVKAPLAGIWQRWSSQFFRVIAFIFCWVRNEKELKKAFQYIVIFYVVYWQTVR
jgi:hypothetical protein